METTYDLKRKHLIVAVEHGITEALPPADAARKLRDFAKYAKTVGEGFSCGCPLARCDLADGSKDGTPEWARVFYTEYDYALRGLTRVFPTGRSQRARVIG